MTVPISLLDLALVGRDETVREALDGSVALARLAERLGFTRVWYAEHHNMASIASSATSVLIAHVAARAKKLGYPCVILAVNKRNEKAIGSYKKYGFVVREAIVDDIGHGFVMDDYVMEKKL